jgi:hypothetical protein
MSPVKAIYRSWAIPCTGKQVYAPRHRAEWLGKITELRKEADIYCKNLAILALHWDQEINEVELAHPNLQTRPPDYGDAVRVKHKDEYAMRRWPEAQALRVSLASRLPAKQIDKVNQEVPRGPDLFDSRYLEQPADLRTIQEYLEALARYI